MYCVPFFLSACLPCLLPVAGFSLYLACPSHSGFHFNCSVLDAVSWDGLCTESSCRTGEEGSVALANPFLLVWSKCAVSVNTRPCEISESVGVSNRQLRNSVEKPIEPCNEPSSVKFVRLNTISEKSYQALCGSCKSLDAFFVLLGAVSVSVSSPVSNSSTFRSFSSFFVFF